MQRHKGFCIQQVARQSGFPAVIFVHWTLCKAAREVKSFWVFRGAVPRAPAILFQVAAQDAVPPRIGVACCSGGTRASAFERGIGIVQGCCGDS